MKSAIAVGLRAVTLAAALALGGCVQVGGRDFPQASAGFVPHTSYAVGEETAWNAVISALTANNIPITSASKETRQITTEYVAGPGQLTGLGLISADSSRYRYTIFIVPEGRGRTTITVSCALEMSSLGDAGATPFEDVSGGNVEVVSKLRNWLYEQIDRALQSKRT